MMSNTLDKFTKRARRTLTYAQEEAVRLKHNYLGTEHLLLGLLREEDGIAAKVLRELGVDQSQTRQIVEDITGRGQAAAGTRLSLTPRTKRVIELGVDEARRLGDHSIDTEHLLLGLVREGDGIAVNVLKSMNISPEKVDDQVKQEVAKKFHERTEQEIKTRIANGRKIQYLSIKSNGDFLAAIVSTIEWSETNVELLANLFANTGQVSGYKPFIGEDLQGVNWRKETEDFRNRVSISIYSLQSILRVVKGMPPLPDQSEFLPSVENANRQPENALYRDAIFIRRY